MNTDPGYYNPQDPGSSRSDLSCSRPFPHILLTRVRPEARPDSSSPVTSELNYESHCVCSAGATYGSASVAPKRLPLCVTALLCMSHCLCVVLSVLLSVHWNPRICSNNNTVLSLLLLVLLLRSIWLRGDSSQHDWDCICNETCWLPYSLHW